MEEPTYFDQVADQWDEMRKDFFSEAVREAAFTTAKIEAGKTAADIGAGTGFVTEGLLLRGMKVIAVDPSKTMLNELKKKYSEQKGLDCRVGDTLKLPMRDEEVDYAFANMCLHHVEDPRKALKEAARILQAGGRLVITDLDEHDFDGLKKEHHDRWMGFKREDIASWLEEAGLIDVRVDGVGQDCCSKSCSSTDSASVSIFIASGTKPLK